MQKTRVSYVGQIFLVELFVLTSTADAHDIVAKSQTILQKLIERMIFVRQNLNNTVIWNTGTRQLMKFTSIGPSGLLGIESMSSTNLTPMYDFPVPGGP